VGEPRFIEIAVAPNEDVPEGIELRFKADGDSREVTQILYEGQLHSVVGWSSHNGGSPVAALATLVEDSGGGTAVLVHGGDWGVRLYPDEGKAPVKEAYLLVTPESVIG
jgi:hypothetical protein